VQAAAINNLKQNNNYDGVNIVEGGEDNRHDGEGLSGAPRCPGVRSAGGGVRVIIKKVACEQVSPGFIKRKRRGWFVQGVLI
jgi:hypothetical protein